MITQIKDTVNKDIKILKRKYIILKIKWVLLFVLPILLIVLAYQVSRQFLKIRMKELGATIKQDGAIHDTDKHLKA